MSLDCINIFISVFTISTLVVMLKSDYNSITILYNKGVEYYFTSVCNIQMGEIR